MFKLGSKFLFGLAAFGLVAAVAYSIATGGHEIGMDSILGPLTFGYKGYVGEHVGYTVLVGLALSSLGLGVLVSGMGDGDAEVTARSYGLEAVPEQAVPAGANYWPVVGAFSLAAVAVGLAVGPVLFIVGMVGLAATAFEWTSHAWADRATGDPETNRKLRNSLLNPIEIPIGSALIIVGIVVLVSRILLAVPSLGSLIFFGLVPAIILALGVMFVLRPDVSRSIIAATLVAGAVLLLVAGIAAAIVGERDHGDHEEGRGPVAVSMTEAGR